MKFSRFWLLRERIKKSPSNITKYYEILTSRMDPRLHEWFRPMENWFEREPSMIRDRSELWRRILCVKTQHFVLRHLILHISFSQNFYQTLHLILRLPRKKTFMLAAGWRIHVKFYNRTWMKLMWVGNSSTNGPDILTLRLCMQWRHHHFSWGLNVIGGCGHWVLWRFDKDP